MSEWISVGDRLPTKADADSGRDAILVWDGYSIRRMPICLFKSAGDITHWQPLPKPPKPKNLIDSFIADGGFDKAINGAK